jgi:hypothetical protein
MPPEMPEPYLRERLDREDELLHHRTTWVVGSQAFLLNAYGNCLVGSAMEAQNPRARSLEFLMHLLPWTGVSSLVALYLGVFAALLTMRRLRRGAGEGVVPLRMAGTVGPLLVPAVFLATWILLMVERP